MEIPRTHKEWFQFWIDRKQVFWVRPSNHKWEPWLLTQSVEYQDYYSNRNLPPPKHRIVFSDEIIFDIDIDDKYVNRKAANSVMERLKRDNLAYDAWATGSKKNSHHIHVIFQDLINYPVEERKKVKHIIMHYYGLGFLEKSKIDMQKIGKKVLIRMEGSEHEETSNIKTLVAHNKILKQENLFPEHIKERIRVELFQEKKSKKRKGISIPIIVPDVYPPCISYFLSSRFGELKDLRKTALFILTSFFKNKMICEQLYLFLWKWNEEILDKYFEREYIYSLVYYHMNQENICKRMGCNHIQNISLIQIRSQEKETMKQELCDSCWCKDQILSL